MSWWQVSLLLAAVVALIEYKDRQRDAVQQARIRDKDAQIDYQGRLIYDMGGSEWREPPRRARRKPLISDEQFAEMQQTGRTAGRYKGGVEHDG